MKRREFITLLGGAAAAWPLAARAQQPERMRRVGMLIAFFNDSEFQGLIKAFRQSLEAQGWVEGKNVQFDERWAQGDASRIPSLAAGWPLAAQAQQPMPVIGFLGATSPDAANVDYLRVFRQALKESGYVEGENVAIEYRWA